MKVFLRIIKVIFDSMFQWKILFTFAASLLTASGQHYMRNP
jgi:hypothetical protein